jgi:hypothetical protein
MGGEINDKQEPHFGSLWARRRNELALSSPCHCKSEKLKNKSKRNPASNPQPDNPFKVSLLGIATFALAQIFEDSSSGCEGTSIRIGFLF